MLIFKNQTTIWLLITGLAISAVANLLYAWNGYSMGVLFGWGMGVIFVCASFLKFNYEPNKTVIARSDALIGPWQSRGNSTGIASSSQSLLLAMTHKEGFRKVLTWQNCLAILALVAAFSPLYLYKLYEVPWQINTDEVVIMSMAKRFLASPMQDLLGLSDYFGFPTLIFVVFGWVSEQIGGIDLAHFRIVHASFGLGIVLLAYLFFSQITTKWKALAFASILGSNHALLAISRMAMRDNTGLFLELSALVLAVFGIKNKNYFSTALAGVAAGFGFYTYFPARIVPFIWLASTSCLALLYLKSQLWKYLFSSLAIFLLTFTLTSAPVLIASINSSQDSFNYQKQQFLFLKEGQKLEMEWTGKPTPREAWITNIKNGLTTFNNKIHDQGYIYPNYRHGFLDSISGILLWLGIILIAYKLWKGERTLGHVLAFSGFFILYISFAFLITKAPNYTRLLVILPFTTYFIGSGLFWIVEKISFTVPKQYKNGRSFVYMVLSVAGTLAIALLNLNIFNDFVAKGAKEGNDVGSTARYIEQVSENPGHKFFLAADKNYPYYSWSDENGWRFWMEFFVQNSNQVKVVAPSRLAEHLQTPGPLTVFMSEALFKQQKDALLLARPSVEIIKLKSDGSLVAVEME